MFAELLAHEGVDEVMELRSSFGIMAYHGGSLEEMTDVIARAVAERSGASYYGVHQPASLQWHIPSIKVDPAESEALTTFFAHVHTVITVHGFGRAGFFTSLLLGGQNRRLAAHVGAHLKAALPAYQMITEIEEIPKELRGLHASNPVNVAHNAGVQIELPPRVRGSSPLWWDWEHGLTPHTVSLIDGLVRAVTSWDQ